jgi:hypothetical protein
MWNTEISVLGDVEEWCVSMLETYWCPLSLSYSLRVASLQRHFHTSYTTKQIQQRLKYANAMTVGCRTGRIIRMMTTGRSGRTKETNAHHTSVLLAFPFSLSIYCLVSSRKGDRGSRVILVGLGSNVISTSSKGADWERQSRHPLMAHTVAHCAAQPEPREGQMIGRACLPLNEWSVTTSNTTCIPRESRQSKRVWSPSY